MLILLRKREMESRPRGYTTVSCSTQLSFKFIMLKHVNVKISVGILTFMSMINTTFESWKASTVFIFPVFLLL